MSYSQPCGLLWGRKALACILPTTPQGSPEPAVPGLGVAARPGQQQSGLGGPLGARRPGALLSHGGACPVCDGPAGCPASSPRSGRGLPGACGVRGLGAQGPRAGGVGRPRSPGDSPAGLTGAETGGPWIHARSRWP